MKPLTLEETALKEEMKERCLAKGQYIDEKAKEKFDMLCHLEDFEVQYWELLKENQELKKQLEYLRSGEYYNQLRFERDMLQNVVDNGEVSKEDKAFIDMTHRNTELLEVIEEVREYIKEHLTDNGRFLMLNEWQVPELLQILDKVKEN